jgi:hypothetical protein
MTLKPGDKVTVKGWDGEYVVWTTWGPNHVVLESSERVAVSRCTPVKRPAKFPEDWGRKAEFLEGIGAPPCIDRIAGYVPGQANGPCWIPATGVLRYKYCYIYEREQS